MKHIFVIERLTLTFFCSLDKTLTMDQFEGVCVFFSKKYVSLLSINYLIVSRLIGLMHKDTTKSIYYYHY
jgi:hypothetical protein